MKETNKQKKHSTQEYPKWGCSRSSLATSPCLGSQPCKQTSLVCWWDQQLCGTQVCGADKPLECMTYQHPQEWFYNKGTAPFSSAHLLESTVPKPQVHRCSCKCENLNEGKISAPMRNIPGQLPKQTQHLQLGLTTPKFGSLSIQFLRQKRHLEAESSSWKLRKGIKVGIPGGMIFFFY